MLGTLRPGLVAATTRDLTRLPQQPATSAWGGVVVFAGAAYVAAGGAPIITTAMASADMRAVDRLLGHNVQCYLQPSAHTHHFINQYDVGGNRTQQLAREAAPIRLAAAAATLQNADWLHVGPLMPNDIAPELWQQLRYQPQPVAVDIQGCLRQRRGRLLHPGASQLAPALHAANILKADRSEWELIVAWHQRCGYADRGQSNHRNAASANAIAGVLRFWNIDLLLLTEGHQGGSAWSAAGQLSRWQPPTVAAGDPTGAGDVFLAAFLAAHFGQCQDLTTSLASASSTAARHCNASIVADLDTASA